MVHPARTGYSQTGTRLSGSQDRVEQVIQRFEVMRDRADRLISAAERIFGRSESVRKEPAHQEPTPAGPAPSEPVRSEPEATDPA